ncbi:MAG: SGNH/GDSL hydrolase family protein [Bacillota bacterium]|nr:SGNH/GDSL hydrolase family protein [Bacillota bacterium]
MKFLCIGDSNTEGYDPRSPIGEIYEKNWPILLSEYIGIDVINEGISGACVGTDFSYVLNIMDENDRLIIFLGSNDVYKGHSVEKIEANKQILNTYKYV